MKFKGTKNYVSTDCPTIKSVSKKYKAVIINRPKKLCTKSALGEDVYRHGYMEIKKDLKFLSELTCSIVFFISSSLVIKCL